MDRIIFLSSISAFDGCSSLYGRAKLEIEKVAADVGATIIRSGLVHGSQHSGGMFGSLQRMAAKLPVIPFIDSGKHMQYLVHEEDLCELILRICRNEINAPGAPLVAAFPRGWQVRKLLQVLAATQCVNARFLPLPWPVIWLGLRISELLGIAMPFRSDSVISLVRQNPTPDFSALIQTGYSFREFTGTLSSPQPLGFAETS